MPFANGEMNRLGIPVIRLAQARIALEQPLKRRHVANRGGSDRVPEVASFVRFQLAWLDHSEPRFGALRTRISPAVERRGSAAGRAACAGSLAVAGWRGLSAASAGSAGPP